MPPRKIILNITPRTWVRATTNDAWFFKIPKEKLHKSGRARREVLDRYNAWKTAVRALANAQKFEIPEQGSEVRFCLPIPKSWKKYKQAAMIGKLHQQKPDLSNLLKAWEDAMISEDKYIAHYSGLSKVWVAGPDGRIEIIIHEPKISSNDVLI